LERIKKKKNTIQNKQTFKINCNSL